MSNLQEEKKLDGNLNIARFPINTNKYYKLDTKQDWVKALLVELNEKAEDKSPEEFLEETSIAIDLELLKKFKPETGEFLLLKGQVLVKYVTQCVRTLEDMDEAIDLELKVCFLDGHLENDDAYADQTETFQEDDMYDLYFYNKKMANIAECIHEQIYLNINQYPVKDADAPLPWGNEGSTTKQ